MDLMDLLPSNLQSTYINSQLFRDYIDACNDVLSTLESKTDDFKSLVNVDYVPDKYLRNLGALIGADTISFDFSTDAEYRNFLRSAVKWRKLKGLYTAIDVILYTKSMHAIFWDMWTEDYATFITQDPAINTPPISNYYKSPHFGLDIILDTAHGVYPNQYLWDDVANPMISFLTAALEEVRPVFTVPHYGVWLNPQTRQDGAVYTASGNIQTMVFNWVFATNYFDGDVISSDKLIYFDDGKYFDDDESSVVNSITKWKIGTGNRNISPDASSFALETVVLQGDVDTIEILSDRYRYTILLDTSVVQSGISELGLFLGDNTTMMVASTFPYINKISGVTARIVVDVIK